MINCVAGAVDKLIGLLKNKDEYLENNIEHTIELLYYIINTQEYGM